MCVCVCVCVGGGVFVSFFFLFFLTGIPICNNGRVQVQGRKSLLEKLSGARDKHGREHKGLFFV